MPSTSIIAFMVIFSFVSIDAYSSSGESDFGRYALIDIQVIGEAIVAYRNDKGRYPEVDLWLDQLINAGYLKKSRNDPWNRAYYYSVNNDVVNVWTNGADGKVGGIGCDYDFSLLTPKKNIENLNECEPTSTNRIVPLLLALFGILAVIFRVAKNSPSQKQKS